MLKHAVSTDQFLNKSLLDKLCDRAAEFSKMPTGDYPKPLKGMTIASIFFEPSTRTRLSFETAIQNLGANLISVENAGEYSSVKKGESLEDTIRTINAYAEGIVMRHPEIGSAHKAAAVSSVPIINAGDGAGDHPTQGLLDVYTIEKFAANSKTLTVAFVGDLLNGRTVHSLTKLLAIKRKVEFIFIAPDSLQIPKKYTDFCDYKHVKYQKFSNWEDCITRVDVLYMTRIQKERFKLIEDYMAVKDSFVLDTSAVKRMKKSAIIMHPLPRINEISVSIDKDPRAIYFEQVRSGLYMRMALLEYLYSD